ncbi:MAG: hypothetical protein AAF288_05960 [Planctomycetota bacterium]
MFQRLLASSLVFACALSLLACESKPGFVGTWVIEDLPDMPLPDGAESATFRVFEDQTAVMTLQGADGQDVFGMAGTWAPLSETTAEIATENGSDGTIRLLEDGSLLATSPGGTTLTFTRAESAAHTRPATQPDTQPDTQPAE